MSFDTTIGKWKRGLSSFDQIFRKAVIEHQEKILDLNTAQLEIGKDSLGELLFSYASDSYAEFKKALGSKSPLGIPDLKLEGDFYSGFVLKFDGSEFFITSTDEKKDHLRDKYGEDIFGLGEDSLDFIRPFLLESYLTILRQKVA